MWAEYTPVSMLVNNKFMDLDDYEGERKFIRNFSGDSDISVLNWNTSAAVEGHPAIRIFIRLSIPGFQLPAPGKPHTGDRSARSPGSIVTVTGRLRRDPARCGRFVDFEES